MNLNMPNTWRGWLRIPYVVLLFCSAFFLGALKGILVGPVAGLIIIIGNIAVILGLFPAHVAWAIYTIIKTNKFDALLKVAILFALPALFALWLGLSIAGSVLVGVGYGFFTPWISAFEAFRHDDDFKKFWHCIVDGTWDTIRGSCTMVQDFADICYHSYPNYLKEIREPSSLNELQKETRESSTSNELQTLRLIHVPGIILVGLIGLIVEIPSFGVIAIVKSPYMLIKGWQRLIHDLISHEGPFLETACIPIAGLTILLWPLYVVAAVLAAIFSSVLVALYGSVVAYQERSFRRGVAYVIAMVAEFDEYTNDLLYLREGTIFPKPQYKKKLPATLEKSVRRGDKISPASTGVPSMFMPGLAPSRPVRETIQEVKMVQMWEHMMRSCELRGKELMEANLITMVDLKEWLKAKNSNEGTIVGVGLPSYSCLYNILRSIKAGSDGLLLLDNLVITSENRPQDRLMDWFFQPLMVLKEQIDVIKLSEDEVKYLEKVVLFGSNNQRMEAWDNGGFVPQDPVRAAQIQGISRRLTGVVRSMTKLPTYRRKFGYIVKGLVSYDAENEGSTRHDSVKSVPSIENV
ncbi:hypothetical protein Ancab_003776 [Ancistrocladus abbreviatus]